MKPKIWKSKKDGSWVLTYGFHPRSMWMYGANEEERRRIKDNCISHVSFDSGEEACESLACFYYQGNCISHVSFDSWEEACESLACFYYQGVIRR